MRTIVAVSAKPEHAALLDMLVADVSGYDVIQVVPIATAYSLIRKVTPDLIVVMLRIDDVKGCQLLSMLAIDPRTCHIPIISCTFDPQGDYEIFLGIELEARASYGISTD